MLAASAAKQRPEHEHHDAEDEHPHLAELLGELADDRHRDGLGERVAGSAQPAEASDVSRSRRCMRSATVTIDESTANINMLTEARPRNRYRFISEPLSGIRTPGTAVGVDTPRSRAAPRPLPLGQGTTRPSAPSPRKTPGRLVAAQSGAGVLGWPNRLTAGSGRVARPPPARTGEPRS